MYIREIRIKNVRSLEDLDWRLPAGKDCPGWHVIIGDNGSGKSSVLRATALALVGPEEVNALWEDWNAWLRHGMDQASIRLGLEFDQKYDLWAGAGQKPERTVTAELSLSRQDGNVKIGAKKTRKNPDRHIWSGKPGWFSVAYGPFRRFRGGDRDLEKLFYTKPRLARHLSVFGENVALSECLGWMQQLRIKQYEDKNGPESKLLDALIRFINESDLLPQGATLAEVKAQEVIFRDGNGAQIAVDQLSDGFRSILSMTFELIWQMAQVFKWGDIFDRTDGTKIVVPGVALIDEIDAHLHPSWQHRVGLWFREHFPRMQFIVTTHSPIVCQAADVGSVFRLITPGNGAQGTPVEGIELERLLYGNVLDAYGTEMFGEDVTRSEKSKQFLRRLAKLNQKELHGGIDKEEAREQERLRAMLPTAASTAGDGPETGA